MIYLLVIIALTFAIPKVRWALYGNDEDGYYGDLSFNPQRKKTLWIGIRWWAKNPFHNFTWHVIGLAGKAFTRSGDYPDDNFSPVGGRNNCVAYYNGKSYPFWSNVGKRWAWYFGWRQNGAFGIKLIRARSAFPK